MARILLVDDHPVVRQGIHHILAASLADATIDEAGTGDEALAKIRGGAWDLVVLDLTMPGLSGLDLVKLLRRERPKLPVLILSMHPAAEFARRALSAGAYGYITKESAPAELVTAVNHLLGGQKYVSPSLAEQLALGLHPDRGERPHERLSDREYQVLRMLARGKTVSQIAADLSLSVKTVSTYRARVLDKLNMKTTAELMRYGIENRLLNG